MALKGNWVDKVNGVDDVNAEDINDIANSVIELENEENIPADITSLGQVRSIGDEIKFPVQDTSANLKYFTWGRMRKAVADDTEAAIEESHKTALVEAAYAVSDSRRLHYAFLPEGMTEDGVLVLQSDLPVAIGEALAEAKASGEFNGKDGTKIFHGGHIDDEGSYDISEVEGAKAGDYYLNDWTGRLYYAYEQSNQWGYITDLRPRVPEWHTSAGYPDFQANDGDYCVDTVNGSIYQYWGGEEGEWELVLTLSSSRIFISHDGRLDGQDIDVIDGAKGGDYCIDTVSGIMFYAEPSTGVWEYGIGLKDTPYWYNGVGEPFSHDRAGDYYLDIESGKLYESDSYGGWDFLINLRPIKGEDYWTEEDKAEMVADVLAALPTWNGGSY